MSEHVDVQLHPGEEIPHPGKRLFIAICDASPAGAIVFEVGCEEHECPYCHRTVHDHGTTATPTA
jgi:hypothetical protein